MFHACETRRACKPVPQSGECVSSTNPLTHSLLTRTNLQCTPLNPAAFSLTSTPPPHNFCLRAHPSSFFILLHTLGGYLTHPLHHHHTHTPSPFHSLLPSSLPLFTSSAPNPHLYPFTVPTGSQMRWTEHQCSGRW